MIETFIESDLAPYANDSQYWIVSSFGDDV
jgi:hypothetical protein